MELVEDEEMESAPGTKAERSRTGDESEGKTSGQGRPENEGWSKK